MFNLFYKILKNTLEKSENNLKIFPVILSGGNGTRLWPLSRSSFPKQYLKINDKDQYTLLQNTFKRLKGINNLENPIIICNEEQRFIVAEQMREINVKPKSILLEQIGRNTAPAIALAALKASNDGEDPLLLILSADHEIKDNKKFVNTINKSIKIASEGRLVTFGVKPEASETGYGYIEAKEKLSENVPFSSIRKFIEKPKKEIALKLVKDNRFTWNSGIFLFKASTIINELYRFAPEIIKLCTNSLKDKNYDLNFQRLNNDYFKECPNISIDIAVLEKTNLGTVFLLEAGWSDVGSWKSVWKNSDKDKDGNAINGKTIINNSKNCYLKGKDRLVVGIDIENLIIIETNDAVLVSNKESSQKLKDIVNELEEKNIKEGKFNNTCYRPWGHYTSVAQGKTWQVKRLEIKSHESLSLQLHNFRSEHWIVVNGTAKVEINGKVSIINVNESIYVPLGSKHRLSNHGVVPLILIEIQNGEYLGEDDIIRFDDKYGR